jgi:hypothetical protein
MPSRELFPVVAFVAYLLFALLCNLLMLILTLLVMFAGPIGWLVG